MNAFRKTSLIIVTLLAAAALTFGLGMNLKQQRSKIVSASGSDGNKITAVIKGMNPTEYSNQMGTVRVGAGAFNLQMNGEHKFDIIDGTTELTITARPGDPHFEFGTGAPATRITVRENGVAYTNFIQAPDNDNTRHRITLTINPDKDYLIEVNIVAKQYDLNVQTVFAHNRTTDVARIKNYFQINGQPTNIADRKITWGALNVACTRGTIFNAGDNNNFRLVDVEIKHGASDAWSKLKIGHNLLDNARLGSYLNQAGNGQISIRAIYSEILYTRIQGVENSSGLWIGHNELRENIAIKHGHTDFAILGEHTGPGTYFFDRGSIVTLYASNTNSFTFREFVINNSAPSNKSHVIEMNLQSNLDINVKFITSTFTLFMVGRDQFGNEFDLGANLRVSVNGGSYSNGVPEGMPVSALRTLRFAHDATTLDAQYTFKQYFVQGFRGASNDTVATSSALETRAFTIDDTFIRDHSSGRGQIYFVVDVIRKFALTVTYSSPHAGYSKVNGEVYDPTQTYYFNEGDEINFEAITNPYHTFIAFDGAPTNNNASEKAFSKITVGSSDIGVHLVYEAWVFKIDETENFLLNHTTISVGTTLTIRYSGPNSSNISNWTINGKPLSYFDATRERRQPIVNVEVTAAFLDHFFDSANSNWITTADGVRTLKFDNKITTSMGTGTLIAIITPSVVIPLTLCILLYFVLVNNKRKKIIRANLTEKMRTEHRMNTGSFISGLRDGTHSGQVTNEDVKRAMKEEKGRK